MTIIGLMGSIGCGKGTVADLLVAEYSFKTVTVGDMVREEVTKRGLEITREITTQVSTELRSKDPSYFIKKIIEHIKSSDHNNWIIDGIRLPLDVKEYRKAFPEIKFIRVDVNPKLRFERMLTRGRADMPKTYEEFTAQEELEKKRFNLDETFSYADIVLINEGSREELETSVRELMESF